MSQQVPHTFQAASHTPRRRALISTLTVACLTLINLPVFGQQFHSNDVTPPSSTSGKLTGASSGKQVGGGSNGHALLLTGNALSAVDLNPAGCYSSMATSTDDVQQCGYGYSNLGTHAALWSGSSASSVDLHPSGYMFSYCTGVHNGQQVGFAENMIYFLTLSHALLWNGSAVAVDLHPTALPYNFSRAMSVRDGEQVGYVSSFAYPSTGTSLAATPAPLVIPEGTSSAAFVIPTGGATLTVPSTLKIYATDGAVSQAASLTLTPVVNLFAATVNAVEGGFSTYGTLTLSIPAQAGGAMVTLTSSNPTLVTVPASVMIPQGYTSASFVANTSSVVAITSVPVTATFNGLALLANVSLNPAPVVALASLSAFPAVVGGQTIAVTVNLTNFPRNPDGAVVTLSSGDVGTLQVPATVTVPQGSFSATFIATTVVVPGIKGVSVKAVYNGTTISSTIMVNPIPTVTITTAEYLTDLQLFKVVASTSYANSILTYGTDPTSPPLGTMQFELGAFKGSMLMATAPAVLSSWWSTLRITRFPTTPGSSAFRTFRWDDTFCPCGMKATSRSAPTNFLATSPSRRRERHSGLSV